MAAIFEPTVDQHTAWDEFVQSRPDNVRVVAEKFLPWKLYRLKSTGHRVVVREYNESLNDGDRGKITLTVAVLGEYNLIEFERLVFGIDPSDLTECELPLPGEPVGAQFAQDEINLDEMRLRVRPDLWERSPDGKAVWIGDGPGPDES